VSTDLLWAATSNPFSTRFTRPDAGEFLFPDGADADSLIARLRGDGWWGQITGPHGSGKSTLVYTLLPKLHAVGRRVELYSLHPTAPPHLVCLPADPTADAAAGSTANSECGRRDASPLVLWRERRVGWDSSTQIVVDGCEQLGWLQRSWLKWHCRRRRSGLLVTAHRGLGLPPLWRTQTSAELAQGIVARLLGGRDAGWLRAEQVERLFAEHHGNVREVLFALYDSYERVGR
jgi:hypothetical protein